MLKNFTVINILDTRSDSVVNINGTGLKFNMQTAQELGYPAYVQVLISPKDKQFAIRPCKENDPSAIEFSKPKGEQKYRVMVRNAVVLKSIREMAPWKDDNWNVPGIFCAEDVAILYDLKAANKPVYKGGGWGVKKQKEAAARAAAEEMEE